ncbi:MAG TPA: hypothetical protein VFB79_15875 [Candidatus Angelobacter sp.]|nr:hypothetical protein [Candidatus Angelobacter sp.]
MRPIAYRRPRLGGLGADLSQFTSDEILSAYSWLQKAAQQANQERISQTQWLAANGSTLSDDGKQQAIAALTSKTDAVNSLYDALSKFQAVLQAVGINPPGLSGFPRRGLGALGLAPLVIGGVIAAVLIAVGIGIYAIKAKDDAANAQFAQAQNMKAVAGAVANQINAAKTPQDVAAILAAWMTANNPDAQPKPFPWDTALIVAGAFGVAWAVFG